MTKIKFSNLIVLGLLFIMAFCLTACSKVNAQTITNTDGTIDELVYVTLDKEYLISENLDVESVMTDVSATGLLEAKQILYDFQHRVDNDILLTENEEVKEVLKDYRQSISIIHNIWENETYSIGLKFDNQNVYNYYYNITNNTTTNSKTEEHYYYNKIYYYGTTMYQDYSELNDRLINKYTTLYGQELTNSCERYYTYVTESSREHSNADQIVAKDGFYYHTWNIANVDQDGTYLYIKSANRGHWLLTCLYAGLGISFILVSISFINFGINKKKIKKQNEKEKINDQPFYVDVSD